MHPLLPLMISHFTSVCMLVYWVYTGWCGKGGGMRAGGRANLWPLGGRQELPPGSRASRGAACWWPGGPSCWLPGGRQDLGPGSGAGCGAGCWPPGGTLINWVSKTVFFDFFFLLYLAHI